MSKIVAWFRSVFGGARSTTKKVRCLHDFETDFDVMSAYAKPWFKCRKCGHEEGL